MDVQITSGEKWKRHLEITLPSSEFDPHYQKNLKDIQRRSNLDGFRKGKAPIQLINKMFGEAIRRKTIDDLLPDLLKDIFAKHQLNTIGPAQIEKIDYDPDEGLKVQATLEVEPEVELKTYTGLEVEQVVYEVSDDDVSNELEAIREKHAWLESIDSGAQDGHLVLADFQMVDDNGLPLIGHKYEEQRLRVSEHSATEGDFTPQLIGVKPDESRIVKSTRKSPEGEMKEVHYRVDVKEVSEKNLPPLDDDLASTVGDFDTLDELRQAVRASLEVRAQTQSRDELRDTITNEILRANPFELPQGMVDAYTKAFIESLKKDYPDLKEDEIQEEAQSRTVRFLKWRYLRDRIAEVESLFVMDEELRNDIIELAEAEDEDPQRKINQIMNNENEREELREQLLDDKVMTFLESKTKISQRRMAFGERNKSRIITA